MVGPAKVYRLQCSMDMKMSNFNGIGYAFEPVRDRPAVSDYHHMEDDQFQAPPTVQDRVGGSDWCVCGRCRSMDTATESICDWTNSSNGIAC